MEGNFFICMQTLQPAIWNGRGCNQTVKSFTILPLLVPKGYHDISLLISVTNYIAVVDWILDSEHPPLNNENIINVAP